MGRKGVKGGMVLAVLIALFAAGVYLALGKADNNVPIVAAVEPVGYNLKLLTLTGQEVLKPGSAYTIKWEQTEDLSGWGDEVTICVLGFKGGKMIPAKGEWNKEICSYREGDLTGGYLLAEAKLSAGEYKWTVPAGFAGRFTQNPTGYKVRLMVFDNLPPEGRTEWAGNVGYSESGDYIFIE
jgi:hypothetical protein